MRVFSWFHLTQQHFPVELGTLDFHQRANQPQWCFCILTSVFNTVDLSWNSLSELQLLKWIFMIFLRQMTWKWSLKKSWNDPFLYRCCLISNSETQEMCKKFSSTQPIKSIKWRQIKLCKKIFYILTFDSPEHLNISAFALNTVIT